MAGAQPLILTGSAIETAPLTYSGFPLDYIIQTDGTDPISRIGRVLEGRGIDVVLACGNATSNPSLSYNLSRNLAPFPRLVSVGLGNSDDLDWFDDWPNGGSLTRYRFILNELFQRRTDVLARLVFNNTGQELITDKDCSLLQRCLDVNEGGCPVLKPDTIHPVDTVDELLQSAQHGLTLGNCTLCYGEDSVIKVLEP